VKPEPYSSGLDRERKKKGALWYFAHVHGGEQNHWNAQSGCPKVPGRGMLGHGAIV
jgi:hypothetical protein